MYMNKHKKTLNYGYIVVLYFLSMSIILPAHAADGKSYTGSSCNLSGSGAVVVTHEGTITNNSTTSSLKVLCPAVKDQNGIQKVRINVIDPGQGQIDCRVLTRFRDNGVWKGQFTVAKSSSNGDPSIINFNDINQDAITGSHSFIRCIIPKKLGNGSRFHIISYHVTEWG